MNILEHLEHFLGEMRRGWSGDGATGIQVAEFSDTPWDGATTLATIGLSRHELALSPLKAVREELVMVVEQRNRIEDVARLLLHVAERTAMAHDGFLRGQTISADGLVVDGGDMAELYASIPVVFPDGIQTLATTDPPTVVVWLIPLRAAESHFIAVHGWSAFEDCLQQGGVNLADLDRDSVV